MPSYRLYFIDPDGAIDSVEEFSARDDVEAVRISRDARSGQPLELWCRARIVETLAPAGPAPARRGGHC
ncbi:hypothetical protein [Allosphingosinicella sp.]|uniref:hypothetical protein n=1 Tax=Allosphingosinicella sp. TaxID=2823234 RepID=UPI002F17B1BF